jgi:hypothetical protein
MEAGFPFRKGDPLRGLTPSSYAQRFFLNKNASGRRASIFPQAPKSHNSSQNSPLLNSSPCSPNSPSHQPVELSDEQLEVIGQINDLAYEHPNLAFEQLMRRVGIKFASEPSCEMFLAACREVFRPRTALIAALIFIGVGDPSSGRIAQCQVLQVPGSKIRLVCSSRVAQYSESLKTTLLGSDSVLDG